MGISTETPSKASPLLSLPYDIRVQIYTHLFPLYPQIHIMADKQGLPLVPMLSRGDLSLSVLSSCRQLYQEAAGHLYNNFIFNVVGLTKDCVENYQSIQHAVEKHARTLVKTEVLDNGVLSSTACISIYASGGFVEGLACRRQRGVPRNLEEIKRQIAEQYESEKQCTFSSLRIRLILFYRAAQRAVAGLFGVPISSAGFIPVNRPVLCVLLLAMSITWLIHAVSWLDWTQ